MYLLGQACGLIGTVITIILPQFRKKTQMMTCNALVNTMSALNFFFIGQQGSAVYLCIVAIVQSLLSIRHEKRNTAVSTFESVLFFILYVGLGIFGVVTASGFEWALNRQNLLEILPIVGALMMMFSVFAKGEQKTRMFLLFNGVIWMIYTAIVGATTFFTTAASAASNLIALWKYRKK